MGAMYMYIDCVYGCYIHVYLLCIWVLCTGILIVYTGAISCILIVYMDDIYMFIYCVFGCYVQVY